ncbi:hypothetical protein ACFXDO_32160 [Streptomyces nigra]
MRCSPLDGDNDADPGNDTDTERREVRGRRPERRLIPEPGD